MTSGRVVSAPPLIQLLDASHNFISRVPELFLEAVHSSLRSLDLSHNQLTEVSESGEIFGALKIFDYFSD